MTGSLNIPVDKWAGASGAFVKGPLDDEIWQVVGFIDQPAVRLRRVGSDEQKVLVMGANAAEGYTLLQPADPA